MDPSHLETGAVVAIVSSELMEIVKQSAWFPWLTKETATLNRIVSGLVAFAAGIGIGVHFDSVAGTLVISGLLSTGITHGVAQWVQSTVYYRLVIAKKAA